MSTPNILSILEQHAITQPNKYAVYLINSRDITLIDAKITYKELWLEVSKLAYVIKSKTIKGDRVVLSFPTGIDYVIAFYACIKAQVIPVTLTVPTNLLLVEKFLAIIADCNPKLILTERNTLHNSMLATLEASAKILVVDDYSEDENFDDGSLPNINQSDLVFLQYTSGSLSNPKGVMISHANLMDNLDVMSTGFNSQADWVGVNWLPHTHDMGLVGSFLHSIYKGAEIYLMPPSMIIRRPLSWLQAVSFYRATITGGPCFMLKLCLDNWDENKTNNFDFSALKHIVVGSEPINEGLVRDFLNLLEDKGLSKEAFTPAYGLAEATLMVSARTSLKSIHKSEYSNYPIVSCGKLYQNVRIVDVVSGVDCLENQIGEIWINGPSVAHGYWQNSKQTQDSFITDEKGKTYFKTGDLGFLVDNELYIAGRIKEVIIINGVNYYPQDLERSVLAANELLQNTSCVVFRWRPQEAIVDSFVVLIKAGKFFTDDIQNLLITDIKKYLLKTYHLVPFDIKFVSFNFPKTTSGKLQRFSCAKLYKENCLKDSRHITQEIS